MVIKANLFITAINFNGPPQLMEIVFILPTVGKYCGFVIRPVGCRADYKSAVQ